MRTTLTLDEDVAHDLRDRARRTGRAFKDVVNEAIRRGLRVADSAATAKQARFVVKPKACGFLPGIDTGKLGKLADELEIEEFQRKASRSGRQR